MNFSEFQKYLPSNRHQDKTANTQANPLGGTTRTALIALLTSQLVAAAPLVMAANEANPAAEANSASNRDGSPVRLQSNINQDGQTQQDRYDTPQYAPRTRERYIP
ncbi:MAG: hypothetical protein K2W93_12015, partial [Burkholderiaceae bacterium]|nr:hypothetical protein [Burkholderiaceae bacterium]